LTNYFDFFGLPLSPTLDSAALKKTFYANSKRFHPDFHTLENEASRDHALEQSTHNNQGYKILADEDRRLKHLLELKGVLGEEGSNKMPQAFLMEMMEVNEALMELEFDDDPSAKKRIDTTISELEANFRSGVADLLAHYEDATATQADLERLKDYYLKKRYLRRLKQKSVEL